MSKSSFFIPDHQKTGQIAKALDWAHHPLGPVEQWPLCLQLLLSTVFNTRQAVSLFWGEESYYFYNDAYIPILGEAKHLFAMGRPGKEVWGEVWDILEPQIKQIMKTGKATWFEDQYLAVIREGKPPGAFFTYSYSPVIDNQGVVQGTLVICVETTDRVQSALELQNSLQRFRVLSDSLPQLIWTAEKNGDWNYMNRQWLEYTAVPLKFQEGRQWLSLIHPDDQFQVERHWQQSVSEKKTFDLEFRLLRSDGIYRWFRGIAVLQEELWVGSCTDIEVTKQAQLDFEKNVDLSPAILWITEADGFCSYLSQQWYEFTGQTEDQGLGYGWLEATHPDDKESSGKAFIKANNEQTHFRVEYRLRDKFGNYRWAIDSGNARFDAHGKYLGMAGTVFDIHDEVEARQAMQETNRKLETIVNSISEGLVIADSEGQIILWNPASVEQHGFVNQDALLQKLEEFPKLFRLDRLDGTVLPLEDWPMSRVLRGESFKEFEVKLHRMDTGYTWIASYSGTPIKDAQGRILLGLITVRDVTRQITSELDLRKAVNARDEFMSIASHELKTPLTSLKLQTQSAKRKLVLNQFKDMTPEKMIHVFTQNENQINRLVRLVDDMLDLTRVQSGRLSYHLSEVDLCSVLIEVSERLREQFEHAKIALHLHCTGSAIGSFDRERIEQVVINILTNALKYGQNRPVKIDLINEGPKARIEVTDQGLGISPENQLIVFNRFERVVSASEISGLGIGLFITKEIVEAHGGRIWVESELSKGSVFKVELPLLPSQA